MEEWKSVLKFQLEKVFNQPFYFILTVAVGGNFGGYDIDNGIFPQQFVIDYIRVYQ